MNLLIKYLSPYKIRMSIGIVIKFIGTVMDLLIPLLLAHIIDVIVPLNSQSLILWWGSLMIFAAVLAVVLNIIANRMATKVAMLVSKKLRKDCFEKVLSLSSSQLDKLTIPSAVSRLTSDTYELHNFIGMSQRMGARAPILLIVGLIMAFFLDWRLALVMFSVIPVLTVIIFFVASKGIPLFGITRKAGDELVRAVRENITGARVIKALSKTDYENQKFFKINSDVKEKSTKSETIMAVTNPLMNWFLNIGMTAVILAGAFLVNSNLSTPGIIIAFLSYFTIILNAMLSITRVFVKYSKAIAASKRIEEILNLPQDIQQEKVIDRKDSPYHIEFENVSFSYDKHSENLSNISFSLKKGETLGIIGETGSGKTTIINLLMRFYDPDSGTIRINGTNIKNIPNGDLHKIFGSVFQNDILFSDTIKENINFGRNLEDSKILKSAKIAQAEEFIENLPNNYNYMLAIKGSNLSGGQKQRIFISRALASNPQILILDDSSSALDYKTDSLLRKELSENFSNTTKIIITQRVSSIMNANYILVLKDGKKEGFGSHKELIEQCQTYREISVSQLGIEGGN